MVKLKITNSYTYIIGDVPVESLTFFVREYTTKVKRKYKKYVEDVVNQITLYDSTKRCFPSGLTFQYIKYLKEKFGIAATFIDKCTKPLEKKNYGGAFPFEPYEHQAEVFERIKEFRRGIILHPTGSGKTFTAVKIIADKGVRSLYLVNSIDLLNQTVKDCEKWLKRSKIGIIGAGEFRPEQVTIATVQTLWKRFNKPEVQKYLKSVELVIGDEIHHVGINISKGGKTQPKEMYPGNSLYSVIQALENAFYRYGFSATLSKPGTLRRWFLEALTGRIICQTDYDNLSSKEILAKVKIFMVMTPQIPRYRNYHKAYREGIQSNKWVHTMASQIALYLADLGVSTVMMVNRIYMKNAAAKKVDGHATQVYETLEAIREGSAAFLTGATDKDTRSRIINGLKTGDVKIVVGTLLKEGVDIPTLGAAIYLSGNRAQTSDNNNTSNVAIQSVGRVLRNPTRDKRAVFVDFYHNDNGGMLSRHSEERMQAYCEHGYEVVTCTDDDVFSKLSDWVNWNA